MLTTPLNDKSKRRQHTAGPPRKGLHSALPKAAEPTAHNVKPKTSPDISSYQYSILPSPGSSQNVGITRKVIIGWFPGAYYGTLELPKGFYFDTSRRDIAKTMYYRMQ